MINKVINTGKCNMDDYLNHLNSLYGNDPAFDYFIGDIRKALDHTMNSPYQRATFVKIFDQEELCSHAAIIEDNRLSKGSAFFGFFECDNDLQMFNECWNEIKNIASKTGIKRLLGPVNGSIWHSYRLFSVNTEEPYFPSEPLTQPYYIDLFRTLKPSKTIEYHSAYRKRFDLIMKVTEPSWAKASGNGITITKLNKTGNDILKKIYDLSIQIFASNWGFTSLTYDEFLSLYNSDKLTNYYGNVYAAIKGEELLGFCTTIEYKKTFVMKTIGILPEWQGKGVGNALVHAVHADAVQQGIEKIIYALVNKENKVKHFPMDDIHVFREYSALEFKI